MSEGPALLDIHGLRVEFPTDQGSLCAVNGVDLKIDRGKVLGVVGESGCGKSITGLSILNLVPPPGKIVDGEIWFDGVNLLTLSQEEIRRYRGAKIALIPQDPLTSLNPVYTIGDQLGEVLQLHQHLSKAEARKSALAALDQVRLPNAKQRIDDYPHQFSGGMRQRVMIAMALCCKPSLLIADEPTTALDVTVQAQILDLLKSIQRDMGMAIVMITHDLGVVAELCDEVAVMYAGRVVEQASVYDLFDHPKHPYTQGLLNSLPSVQKSRLEPIEGQPPDLQALPPGCSFGPRCKYHLAECDLRFPDAFSLTPTHWARCIKLQDSCSNVLKMAPNPKPMRE